MKTRVTRPPTGRNPKQILTSVIHGRISRNTMSEELNSFDELLSNDDEEFAVAFWMQMVQICILDDLQNQRTHGGSTPGKSPNIQRNYSVAHTRYIMQYFWPQEMLRPGTRMRGPEQNESLKIWKHRS